MQEILDRLIRRARRHADAVRTQTALPRVGLALRTEPGAPSTGLYEPMVCVVLQGAKEALIGDTVLRYDAATSFVASLDLPASGRIVEASPHRPYIGAGLTLDREALGAMLAEAPSLPRCDPVAGFGVAPITPELLEALDLLLALLDTPADIPFLAASREREVLYRLLQGPHGAMLRQIGREDSRLSRVRRSIEWIARHFDQPLRVEALAGIAGMSVASFHRHFKAATAMSPLQYQKRLRLQAARRLLVSRGEAGRAAYAVGYESASQFSREYRRLFGVPPARDAARLLGGGEQPGAI
ncbi:AraC family transcriptional regulator [Aureimonas sp. AU4]|uniref:AraC family transcriptional regulator n=1 Tax=Aureimonas sp. AU4 TaxID=1638163 RepID=UPI00078153CF|nr:AraC family transcriptional regulator [Aureimonas sp. AU4]